MSGDSILEVQGLNKTFTQRAGILASLLGGPGPVQAVRDVAFSLRAGETLGLAGESGCGKTTLGRCLVGMYEPTGGEVRLDGQPVFGDGAWLRTELAGRIQMVFQDPYASLNPRLPIGEAIAEVLRVHRLREGEANVQARVDELLDMVGLPSAHKTRLPHAFSGGQRQRISIARALAVEPDVIVADEPVSALDVSIQAQILNLLEELQAQLGLAYLFISHDLQVMRHISDRIAIMYLGQVVELASTERIFQDPGHPYTRALLSAIPYPDPENRSTRVSIEGELPDPADPPTGCSFHERCPLAIDRCCTARPVLEEERPHHAVRCFRAFEDPTHGSPRNVL